jgi:RNA polymerase sigma-70 factor (ECF subfamily)
MRRPCEAWPEEDELVHLVREAQGGQPGALDALLATLRPSFVRFFAPNVGPDAAEDLAQVALLRITRALQAVDPQQIRAFLATIVRNMLRSERRRETRQARLRAAFADTLQEAADPDPELETCDFVDAVRRTSVGILSPKLRDTMLAALAGVTPSTLAAREGVPASVVRNRLLRARARVRVALGLDGDDRGAQTTHVQQRRPASPPNETRRPIPEYRNRRGSRLTPGNGKSSTSSQGGFGTARS